MTASGEKPRYQPVTSVDTMAAISHLHRLSNFIYDLAAASNLDWDGSNLSFVYKSSSTPVSPEIALGALAQLDLELQKAYLTFGLARYADPAYLEAHSAEMSQTYNSLVPARSPNFAAILSAGPKNIFS